MDDFMKGNFTVKNVIKEEPELPANEQQNLADELKQRVLTSLGGSMVYVERTGLMWDGDESEQDVDGK